MSDSATAPQNVTPADGGRPYGADPTRRNWPVYVWVGLLVVWYVGLLLFATLFTRS